MGVFFVLEIFSVIIQVFYFKHFMEKEFLK